jgi:uncharacterized membrane protein
MKKLDKILNTIAVVLLIIFAILAYFLANGEIFIIQGYINFSLPTILFWISIFFISYTLIKRDIGYLKMVMFLLMIYSFLSLLLYAVRDTTEYDIYSSEEHSVIIKLTEDDLRDYVSIYIKDD